MRKRTNLGELCLLSVIVGCGNLRSPNSEGELGSSVGGSSVRGPRKTKGSEGFRVTSMRKGESEIGDVAGWDWSTRGEVRIRGWGSRCHRRRWQQKRLHCFFKEVKWSAVCCRLTCDGFVFACWVLSTERERERERERVYFWFEDWCGLGWVTIFWYCMWTYGYMGSQPCGLIMDVYLFGPLFLDFIHTTLFKGLWSNGGSGLFKLWPKKNERGKREPLKMLGSQKLPQFLS